MKIKKLISVFTASAVLITGMFSAATTAFAENDLKFSAEYKSSPYYTKLLNALDENKDKSTMEKTLAVSLSQEGYKNYSTSDVDIEQAKADGLLWTGAELRMNENSTGNTEYTRWAQRYVMDRAEETQYLDCDWCAIYVSWCMYQAGYYDKEELKRCYYSYYANPTCSYDADGWILTYNLDQHKVWYTDSANKKLSENSWTKFYNTNTDPMEIAYKPGGLVFFSWDGLDGGFDHVAIVVDYDKDTHVLTYSNGNSDGQVITRKIDLDVEEEFRGTPFMQNSKRIAAYGEYDEIKPLEQKELSCDPKEIVWDLSASSGIKIQTDSESKVCSVYVDGEYLGSTIESNMVLNDGRMAIGKSEMKKISLGSHTLTLKLHDGSIDMPLTITDSTAPSTSVPATEALTTQPVTEAPTTEPVTEAPATEPMTDITTTEPAQNTAKLSENSLKLDAGITKTLKVIDGKAQSWKSSKNSVVSVKNGKVTALKKGTATVTAVLENDVKLNCEIKVSSNPSIKIKGKKLNVKKPYSVKKGGFITLKITGKASGVKNTYQTSKKSVAKVTSKADSKTVKIKGLKPGKAKITVKVNGLAFKIKVKVKK